MTIVKVVKILFLFVYISSFSSNSVDQNSGFLKEKKLIDSLYFGYNQASANEQNAQKIIDTYSRIKNTDSDLSKEDLKILAISYSHLNNAEKASNYLEKYIKKSHNINVLNDNSFDKIRGEQAFKTLDKKFKPMFNFWFVLYFYVGLIGIFLALILNFKKNSDRIANLLISLFILLGSLFILHVCIFITNVMFLVPHSAHATITFNFLYGPLLYFYFKRVTKGYKFKLKDALHLLPFIFFFAYFTRYYLLSSDEKLHLLLNREKAFDPTMLKFLLIIKVLSLLIYGVLIYRMYVKDKKSKLYGETISNWKGYIATLNLAYVLSHIFYVAILALFTYVNYLIYPQLISMSVFILFVGYKAYVQPDIFNKKHLNYKGELFFNKYKKSGLTESLSQELKEQLLKLLHEEKIYKINNINLEILSEQLGTNRHSASQVINEHFNMNFFNLINKFRIQEALEIFKSDSNNSLNIIDVAYDVGYNNKVTFNKAFKEETGITPSQFINNVNEKKQIQFSK
ncbi:helix-turn-helix domain-containing protein [Aureibaculum conchae]|uniref:helix-turn-helix domain-containing protein n=1 Tax=Aureibaculum sp. 2308TA14-22 TaxID=3108392 RepID=UPI0033995B97